MGFKEEFTVAYSGGIAKKGRRLLPHGSLVPDGHFTPEELDSFLAAGRITRAVIEVPDEREVKAFLSDGPGQPETEQLETAATKPKRKRKG